MADKAISELAQATEVTDSDLFVLQQGNVAKKLSGSTLKNYVVLDVVSAEAQTLPAGSDATANYDKANKTLIIGVPTGLTGPEGPHGPQGVKGDKGDTGTTAYESAVEGGYSGTELEFYDELANFSALSQQAQSAATNAASSAHAASASETNAGASATLAESWAVGGTGKRTGEDEDNAQYYAEQAGDANTEAQQARTDIQDSIDGVAQEDTAQEILALVEQIAESGGGASDLNGFGLTLDQSDNSVNLTYTNPTTGEEYDPAKFPTDTTAMQIAAALQALNAAT